MHSRLKMRRKLAPGEEALLVVGVEGRHAGGTGERVARIGVAVEELHARALRLHEGLVDAAADQHAAYARTRAPVRELERECANGFGPMTSVDLGQLLGRVRERMERLVRENELNGVVHADLVLLKDLYVRGQAELAAREERVLAAQSYELDFDELHAQMWEAAEVEPGGTRLYTSAGDNALKWLIARLSGTPP